MGLTKFQVFTPEQNQLADFAKAFAHPARVAILQHVARNQSCICGDLVEVLPLSQSTISQHLKELKRIGILRGEIEGPKVCYCIDPAAWEKARQMINAIFDAPSCCETDENNICNKSK